MAEQHQDAPQRRHPVSLTDIILFLMIYRFHSVTVIAGTWILATAVNRHRAVLL